MTATAAKHLGWLRLPNDDVYRPPQIEKLVKVRDKADINLPLAAANAAQRGSTQDVAAKVVSKQVARYIGDQTLPPLISRFLETHWRAYMTHLYVVDGTQSAAWHTAQVNTEKLVWSVQPKSDDESRHQLYLLLPNLFQWVHTLMESRHVPGPEEDSFFAELAVLQVAALQKDAGSVHESAVDSAREPSPRVDSAAELSSDEAPDSGVAEREIDLPPSQPQPEQAIKVSAGESDILQTLVIGSSVELYRERASKRLLRLEWISKGGGVYFFRDQQRGDAICLTADRCIQFFQERSARVC